MKPIWNHRFVIGILMLAVLLLGNFFFPYLMPQELYRCLVITFLLSIVLLKLATINEHMKNKINRGGIL